MVARAVRAERDETFPPLLIVGSACRSDVAATRIDEHIHVGAGLEVERPPPSTRSEPAYRSQGFGESSDGRVDVICASSCSSLACDKFTSAKLSPSLISIVLVSSSIMFDRSASVRFVARP